MITREAFLRLAGQLFDAVDGGGTQPVTSSGGSANAPKFDTSISRKGGLVQYASETDLGGILFWKARAEEPPSDPKYAEANSRQAKALGYWADYRRASPNETWKGERNRRPVVAAPPSARPATYVREAKAADPEPEPAGATAGYTSHTGEDLGDLPF